MSRVLEVWRSLKFNPVQRGVGVVLFMLLVSGLAFGQGTRGSIRGTVTDPNGAIVVGANVRLVDVARGKEIRTVQSNESGEYQFLELEPATYNILIAAPGFGEARLTDIKVEPNRNLQLDAALTVGSTSEDVTVTASQELLDRETPTLGTTVDRRRVQDLPLNGRNVLDLALLQPGVVPANNNTTATFGQGSGIRVNGNRGTENNITLDGSNNNEVAVGGATGAQPRPDAVQEFRLLTSNFEAEFGRNTGSVINVVTRSGTSEYHGNARIFYRPTFLSAARFFDQALPGSKPKRGTDDFRRPFERKEVGGNFGGPFKFPRFGEGGPSLVNTNKAFFFVDYERRGQLIGNSQLITGLPTAAERSGDFSRYRLRADGTPTPLIDPATGRQFPGNQIPVSRFSPIALYYLNFFPIPDATGSASAGANQIQNNHYLTSRVDYLMTQAQTVNVTFNFFNNTTDDPFAFGGSTLPGFGSLSKDRTYNAVVRHTYAISPTMVNSLLIGYARNNQPGVVPQNNTTPAEIGFTSNFVANQGFAGPPRITLSSRGLIIGNTIQGPQARVTENFQLQDSVSYARGNHRFKFGFDGTQYKQDQTFLFVNNGILNFSRLSGVNTTGDDFADFLLGSSPSSIQFGANGLRDYRQKAVAAFAQDTWRVTDALTLSLGLRYEYTSPLTDKFNRVAYYRAGATSQLLTSGQLRSFEGLPITVPAGGRAPVGLVFVGDPDPVLGGTVPAGGVAKDFNNFAPRLGFAYSPGDSSPGMLKTLLGNRSVIRGGFGVTYGAVIGDTALQQLSAPGFNGTNAFFSPACGTLANPFGPDPFPAYNPFSASPCVQRPNPFLANALNISAPLSQFSQPVDPNIRTPYTYQFNLTMERSFHKDYVATLSYVGNRGKKQYAREQINPGIGTFIPVPAGRTIPTPTQTNINSRRLNPDFPFGVTQLVAGADSSYDALEANLQKRLDRQGLLFQVAYTFSKSISEVDTQRGQLDLLDRRFGKSRSSDDVPHRFVTSVIYDLPLGNHSEGFTKKMLSGFSVGGIYTYQSGTPFSVFNTFDEAGTDAVLTYADLGAPFQLLDPRTNDRQAFNANAFRAFADPAAGFNVATQFRRGTSGPNMFRAGNTVNNFDLIVAKKTQLFSETSNFEIRFEAFNALNHTQFTTLDTTLSSSTFGKYTGARESRVVQLGGRFTF
jgi:outer membrane receptor protein involved in Fe transport